MLRVSILPLSTSLDAETISPTTLPAITVAHEYIYLGFYNAYLIIHEQSLEKVSEIVNVLSSIVAMFFTFTLILSGGASCWQVFVLNIHHRGDRRMPNWLKFYLLKPIGLITCVSLPRVKVPIQSKTSKKQVCIYIYIYIPFG